MQLKKVQKYILKKLRDELPGNLTYHNAGHTVDVLNAAESIAIAENVAQYEKKLLLTAALFHDSGFLKGRDEHEQQSCNIARKYLPGYNYSTDEIELICGIIMATRIPQSPKTQLAEILCDADLDYLGRDDFFELSAKLFTELHSEGLIGDENAWNLEQERFMANHSYYTQTSGKIRQGKKEEYINLVKSKILHGS
ncbi:MAG TPA: HD domain-containing protein [Mucilaginibacter sp.]|nr:HD domain-containing protein [Mucilaginibacter sp.]HVW13817.1 HD domain-containing protein [Mucilaginibacter sp.]